VCAADEIWRLQRGSDADCVFFQRMVNEGERITDLGTRQGLWICAAGGRVLARVNTRDVPAVLATLERALVDWEGLAEGERVLPEDAGLEPEHRWEMSFPADGLALEATARDLSGPLEVAPGPDAPRSPYWNRDYVWFSAEELARSLPPAELVPGSALELPLVARRLARFHLVDNVRGQTLPFAAEELVEARLEARVAARVGSQIVLSLRGETHAASDGDWLLGDSTWEPDETLAHGVRCSLVGEAVWDLEAGALTRFDLLALGERWGRTDHNGRRGSEEASPIGFHLGLAPPGVRLAPAFVSVYDAPWVAHPRVGTWLRSPAECGIEER